MNYILEYANAHFAPEGKPIEFSQDEINELNRDRLKNILNDSVDERYAQKEELFGENMREIERVILLSCVDEKWMDNIDAMDQLRQEQGTSLIRAERSCYRIPVRGL